MYVPLPYVVGLCSVKILVLTEALVDLCALLYCESLPISLRSAAVCTSFFSSTNGIIEASDSFLPTYLEHLALCLAHRQETKVGAFSVLRQLAFK